MTRVRGPFAGAEGGLAAVTARGLRGLRGLLRVATGALTAWGSAIRFMTASASPEVITTPPTTGGGLKRRDASSLLLHKRHWG